MDDTTLDAIEARQKAAASARWEIIGGRDGPRALMALLGEDVPALVAEVRRLTSHADGLSANLGGDLIAWAARAEAAEAEVVTLRARLAAVEALADRWQKYAATLDPMSVESAASIAAIATMKGAYEGCAEKIRAALATTGEGE